jgi:hypothetical protein
MLGIVSQIPLIIGWLFYSLFTHPHDSWPLLVAIPFIFLVGFLLYRER